MATNFSITSSTLNKKQNTIDYYRARDNVAVNVIILTNIPHKSHPYGILTKPLGNHQNFPIVKQFLVCVNLRIKGCVIELVQKSCSGFKKSYPEDIDWYYREGRLEVGICIIMSDGIIMMCFVYITYKGSFMAVLEYV